MSFDFIETMQTANIEDNTLIVVQCKEKIPNRTLMTLQKAIQQKFPNWSGILFATLHDMKLSALDRRTLIAFRDEINTILNLPNN